MSDSIIVELDNSTAAKTYAANSENSAVAAASSASSAATSAASAAESKEVASTAASSIQSMLESGTYSTSIAQLALEESTGYGVINGYRATVSNGIITVDAGIVHLGNGYRYSTASTTFTPTADTTNPRYDLIYISSTGVVSILTGTAAASPVAPSIPAGGLALWSSLITTTGGIVLTDLRTYKPRYQNAGVINVKDFGAVGDGVTDDTAAIQAVFLSKTKEMIFFPTGNYLISSTLTTSTEYPINVKMDSNARIFTETDNLDYLVRLGRWGTAVWEGSWEGGILDANDKAKCGLGVSGYHFFRINGVKIQYFKEIGLNTNPNDIPSYYLRATNVYFDNYQHFYEGSIAIANTNTDNYFDNITIRDTQIAIKLEQYAYVSKMNAWCSASADSDFWKGSIFAAYSKKVQNGVGAYASPFFDCTIDSYRRGFVQLNDYDMGTIIPYYITRNIRLMTDKIDSDPDYRYIVYDVTNYARVYDVGSYYPAANGYVIHANDNKYDLNGMDFQGTIVYADNDHKIKALIDSNARRTPDNVGANLPTGNYLVQDNTQNAPTTNAGMLNVSTRFSNLGAADYVKSIYEFTDLTTGDKYKAISSGTDLSDMTLGPWKVDGAEGLYEDWSSGHIVIGNIVIEWGICWSDKTHAETNTTVNITWTKPVSKVLSLQAVYLNDDDSGHQNAHCQIGNTSATGAHIKFFNSDLDRCHWLMIGEI